MTLPTITPPSLIDFAGDIDALNAEADRYVSGVGFTVAHLRSAILDGLPVTRRGLDIPSWIIRDAIDAAESKVESDVDLFIWERDIYCVSDQDDSDLDVDDDRVIYGALDKPRNWFSGSRFGEIKLPRGPAKRIVSVKLLPFGFFAKPIDIPVGTREDIAAGRSRVRLDKNRVRFVPGKNGLLFGSYGSALFANINDGQVIPNGVEIIYRAGLSPRELRQEGAKLRTLVLIQAAIQSLTLLQIHLANGAQKESLATDGLQNSVEVAKRDGNGPYGGELASLKSNYRELLRSVQADNGITWAFL